MNVLVANSTFKNQSTFGVRAKAQRLNISNCEFQVIAMLCSNSEIMIEESAWYGGGYTGHSEMGFSGNSIVAINTNVTLTGTVLVSSIRADLINNYYGTPLYAYRSNITLAGNISFVNNTGTNGGAMALYSSTLNIASGTSVRFWDNKATENGGAIALFFIHYEFCLWHKCGIL